MQCASCLITTVELWPEVAANLSKLKALPAPNQPIYPTCTLSMTLARNVAHPFHATCASHTEEASYLIVKVKEIRVILPAVSLRITDQLSYVSVKQKQENINNPHASMLNLCTKAQQTSGCCSRNKGWGRITQLPAVPKTAYKWHATLRATYSHTKLPWGMSSKVRQPHPRPAVRNTCNLALKQKRHVCIADTLPCPPGNRHKLGYSTRPFSFSATPHKHW